MDKTKESSSEKIEVYSNGEGRLYINASELFALKSVQELIKRIVESKDLEGVKKIHHHHT